MERHSFSRQIHLYLVFYNLNLGAMKAVIFWAWTSHRKLWKLSPNWNQTSVISQWWTVENSFCQITSHSHKDHTISYHCQYWKVRSLTLYITYNIIMGIQGNPDLAELTNKWQSLKVFEMCLLCIRYLFLKISIKHRKDAVFIR